MRVKLLCLFLLTSFISLAKAPNNRIDNPAIGVTLTRIFGPFNPMQFSLSIKNIGDVPLTNIYATENPDFPPGNYGFFGSFQIIEPGQEINTTVLKFDNNCFDISQIMIHATTPANIEITDLSADLYGYDSNGLPGSYYNDVVTYSQTMELINVTQEGIYSDSNNNGIVDVGDVIDYTYSVSDFNNMFYPQCQIIDPNAIVADPIFDLQGAYNTTGIHYLTQADVDLGYVYNDSHLIVPTACINSFPFQDATYCSGCPNPNGVIVITKLTGLLPNKISGSVKFNTNNDCATAINFPNRRVSTTDGTNEYTSFSNSMGNYEILIPNSGNYTTNALSNLGGGFSSTPASIATSSSGENVNYSNTDFCIASASNQTDLRVNLFNIDQAIPGFDIQYRLWYENAGTTSLNGTVKITLPADVFVNFQPNPLPNDFTDVTMTWNYTNLLPFERRYIDLGFLVNTPPQVNAGDILDLTVEGTTTTTDNNPSNNTFALHQTVFSSFDPNDKTVLEGESITASQATDYLHYVTRFQNTGTANARTVVVKETLDSDLDWSTFEPLDASHANNVQIRNGNELTYTFPNIDLPYESANEPGSHGWLVYRIKPKSSFALGDVATSGSSIYFDFNLPILTNEVNTSIAPLATSGFVKDQFWVYPNPASHFITIENKNNLESAYEILSANGQSLIIGPLENKNIDISALSKGFYFITIETPQGKATYKFIKN